MSLLCCSSSLALALVVCPNAPPGPALCGFSARSSLSQNPFFVPFPVFLSLHCSLQCLSDHFIGVASVIARFKTCEDLFTLFLPSGAFLQTQQRNWHHHSLHFLCHLSPEKQQQHVQSWGQRQLSGLWGALTHPGCCCFGSSLQPTIDFKLLWPGSELLPYLTKVEWVTDETWLLNVSSLGQGLLSLWKQNPDCCCCLTNSCKTQCSLGWSSQSQRVYAANDKKIIKKRMEQQNLWSFQNGAWEFMKKYRV